MMDHERDTGLSRPARWTGALLVAISAAAIVLSLGAPGLGWALASIILVLASFCIAWLGRRIVAVCLAVAIVHFFTFGPFTYQTGSAINVSWLVSIGLGWGPLLISSVALIASIMRFRFSKNTS